MGAKSAEILLRRFLVASVFVVVSCEAGPSPSTSTVGESPRTSAKTLKPPTSQLVSTGPVGVIAGQIRDRVGRPVPGARVTLLGDLDADERGSLEWSRVLELCPFGVPDYLAREAAALASTDSDENGGYSFSGLPDGAYLLRITAPGFAFTEEAVTVVEADPARSRRR